MELLIFKNEDGNYVIEKVEIDLCNNDPKKEYIALFTEFFLAKLFCKSYLKYISEGKKFKRSIKLSCIGRNNEKLKLISKFDMMEIN